MLKITNIDLDKIFNGDDFYFTYIFESLEDKKIKVNIGIYDYFSLPVNNTNLEISTNIRYFTTFDKITSSTWRFGFTIIISNEMTGEILFQKKYNPPIKKNTIWLIGDSHVTHFPENKLSDASNYNIKKFGFESLSLNRFLNSDYLGLFNQLNVSIGDCFVFYLSEIDIRISIHRYSKNKKLNLEQTFNKLMDRYLNCILIIKNIYNNKIVILSPNPPLETYTNENLIMGSKEDRMSCQKLFDSFWKKHHDVVHYINWTEKYQKVNGFMNVDFLIKNDHHIYNFEPFIHELKKELNKIL